MKNSKLGSCRIKSELLCHAKILVNTCWPRIQKFTLKVKNSPKNEVFGRCWQNDGGYLEYRSSEHDTLFKTLLRDVFSSKIIHIIISLIFMKNSFFETVTFSLFQSFLHMILCIFSYYKSLKKSVPRKTEISQEWKKIWRKCKR